jgi:hypothetical protein
MGILTYDSTWPLYNYHWTEHPTAVPAPAALAEVSFNDVWSQLAYDKFVDEDVGYGVYNNWANRIRVIEFTGDDSGLIVTIQLNRTGDLSSSLTVPVILGDYREYDDHSEVQSYQNATFAAGQSTANMTVAIDTGFVYHDNVDIMTFTIVPSPDYDIMETYNWGEGMDGGNIFYLVIGEEEE